MLWQVWIILHSWIFCWLLPVGCSMICLHPRVKQSQSFPQDQTFYTLPSAPSCCLHITDTSLSKHFKLEVVHMSEFLSVLSEHHSQSWTCVSSEGCGCVSVLLWDCACEWWNRTWSLMFSSRERERGCNWDSWVNGSQLWEWRCWQGEVILVFCQVRHWKCQCAAKACHPFIVSDEQFQSLG